MPRQHTIDTLQLMQALQARHPLKTWSLVITFFGDTVLPRGGTVPLAVIVAVLGALGVDAATVRAAVARLTRDGWLVRERRGRSSDYRLDARGRSTFSDAEARIYSAAEPRFSGRWTFAVAHLDAGANRTAVRDRLRTLGFGVLDNTVFVRPETAPAQSLPELDGVSYFDAAHTAGTDPEQLLAAAYDLAAIDAHYRRFTSDFSPLLAAPAASGADAAALRTVMIHEYRRALLRAPQLPGTLSPTLAHRAPARDLATNLYRHWLAPSEAWLDSAHSGWLESADQSVSSRFM